MAKITLDRDGIKSMLRSAGVRREVNQLAHKVAGAARAQGHTVTSGEALPIKVDEYTTDRAAAAVTITHPAGIGMQAKHGVLTKAAAAAGLTVKAK